MTREQREQIIDSLLSTLEQRFYEPTLNGVNARSLFEHRKEELMSTPEFEDSVRNLLKSIGVHPLDFFHAARRPVLLERLLRATLHAENGSNCWCFQDVHPDGLAYGAGITSGTRLIQIDNRAAAPPERPTVVLKPELPLVIQNGESSARRLTVPIPVTTKTAQRKQQVVFTARPDPHVGYVRVTLFPGLVGVDVAKEITAAFESVKDATRVIIDLRGNPGGGSANLRLMSYLTPGKMPVGYSLTRRRTEAGYKPEDLPRFERIPSAKWMLPLLALRFKFVDKSIAVVTEGLGAKPWHGRAVMLINEHTGSGAEIVAGFATDHKLATLVGARTMGRLLGWATFQLPYDFRISLPVSNYITWEGKCFEGQGIEPHIAVPFSAEAARDGKDNQLERALALAKDL